MYGTFGLLLLAGTMISPADTVVEVRQGDRVVLQDFAGVVHVRAWDHPELRVEGEMKRPSRLRVVRLGREVRVQLTGGEAPDRNDDFLLNLPSWMNVEISGKDVEVRVEGVDGSVTVRSLRGDLLFADLGGALEAATTEGSIEARGLHGSARLRTGRDEIWVENATGSLDLETVRGEILMEEIHANRVAVRTMRGEIEFLGSIQRGGDYSFFSHGGDVDLRLRAPVNMDASVLSYEGEFESDFPVRTSSLRSGEPMDFQVGSGGARLVVETFGGDVQLLRIPGRVSGGVPEEMIREQSTISEESEWEEEG